MKLSDLTVSRGSNYVFVNSNQTTSVNGTNLQLAYNTAKQKLPSSTNRISVIVAPGKYTFSSPFLVDADYIDIVSITGAADVLIDKINVTANNVYLKGINLGTGKFQIGDNQINLICENCVAGAQSFGYSSGTVSGTFINCKALDASFGSGCVASGTFIGCLSGAYSFGGGNGGIASGIFRDCAVGNPSNRTGWSFGGSYDQSEEYTATGTFHNCIGGNMCFGGAANVSGIFYKCVGGMQCFSHGKRFSGSAYHCVASNYSFGGMYGGNGAQFSGKAFHCVVGAVSFGNTELSGKVFHCIIDVNGVVVDGTKNTFTAVSGSGKTRYCVDGNDNANNQG